MRKRYGRDKGDGDDEGDDEPQQQQQQGDGADGSDGNKESADGSERKVRVRKDKAAHEADDGVQQGDDDKENVHPNRKQQATATPAAVSSASGKKRGRKLGSANKEKANKPTARKKKPLQLQLPEEDGGAALAKIEPDVLAAYMEQVKQAGGLQQQMGMLIASHPECHSTAQHSTAQPQRRHMLQPSQLH